MKNSLSLFPSICPSIYHLHLLYKKLQNDLYRYKIYTYIPISPCAFLVILVCIGILIKVLSFEIKKSILQEYKLKNNSLVACEVH